MAHDLAALLGPVGVARASDLARLADRHSLGAWVRARRLLRPYPGVLVLPDRWDRWQTRAVAAVLATDGALWGVSALTAWRVLPESLPVHVAVPTNRRALHRPGLVVHRVTDFRTDTIGPYRVMWLARSLVDAWALGHGAGGTRRDVEVVRGALITTLRDRRLRPDGIRAEMLRRPALPGRAALRELVGLVEQGCESELEIWGVLRVLDIPVLPPMVQQHRVSLGRGRAVRLDAAWPDVRLAVELDGAAFHGSPEQRERDLRRDAALATQGWLVLRFSYRRLRREPDACRAEIEAVYRSRLALLPG